MSLSTFGITADQETARLALRGPDWRRGMGPQGVDPWVKELYGLRAIWRNNGSNDLLRRLVANGFAPAVTQWMQDPAISRIAHWRTIRGYDDALQTFYVNDPMLGSFVPLSYQWIQNNWQPFSYRYLVIYRPEDEALLKAIVGADWSESRMRENFYERTKAEARAQNTSAAWLTHGEASYQSGHFEDALAAFDKGFSLGSPVGVFTVRSSYPQTLRALGKLGEADRAQASLSSVSAVPSSTVASPPDYFAVWMAFRRTLAFDSQLPTD
jgi:tetratricopeptide (TPR) repeat protein